MFFIPNVFINVQVMNLLFQSLCPIYLVEYNKNKNIDFGYIYTHTAIGAVITMLYTLLPTTPPWDRVQGHVLEFK